MTDDHRYNNRGNPGTPAQNSGAPAVPSPASLVPIDLQKRALNMGVLVIGPGADELLSHVFRTTGGSGQRIDHARPGAASLTYLPLRLGDIRGFTTQIHLYGFRDDSRLLPSIAEHLPHAHGLVVTLGQAPSEVVDVAARAKRPVPTALLGPAPQRAAWVGRAGVAPCFEGELAREAVFPAIKAVSRVMLSALKKRV